MSNSQTDKDPPAKKPRASRKKKAAAEESSQNEDRFDPTVLDKMVIALPLMDKLKEDREGKTTYSVIIDLNLDYPGGRQNACQRVENLIQEITEIGRAHV